MEDVRHEAMSQRLRTVRDHIRRENAHDLAAVMETFGSTAKYDDEPWDEHYRGREAVRLFYEQLFNAVPDLEIEVTEEHVSTNSVIVECVIRGTHQGAWRGLPPTRRIIEVPLCGVYTFDEDGKLTGEKIYYDRATVLRQCGVFREPSGVIGRFLMFLNHPITITSAWVHA